MSATQTVPAVVPVAPVVAVAPVAHIAPVAPVALVALVAPVAPVALVALVAPVAPVAPGHRPTKAHKNPDFVLEMPENEGPEGKKSTKTPILCSKCPKMGVLNGKSAQKCRFCARKDRDWHREEQSWPSCKSPRAFRKCKYLITK